MTFKSPSVISTFRLFIPLIIAVILFGGITPAAAAKKIGLIMPGGSYFGENVKESFAGYLRQAGVSPGEVEIFMQRPAADKVSRINSVRKLLAHDMDIMVIFGASASREAAAESGKVPIIFMGAVDPVKQGLVKTMERPGRNITGIIGKTSLAFLLNNIRKVTNLNTLGVLYKSDSVNSMIQLEEVKGLAADKGINILAEDVNASDQETLVARFRDAQFIYLAVGFYPLGKDKCDLGKLGKPIASQSMCVDEQEIVFALVPDFKELLSGGAQLTSQVIRGMDPGNIPVKQIKKINFIINLSEARKFGLNIPIDILSTATKVIK